MTMIQLIACIGMIAGLFMVLHVSPRELSDSLFSCLTAAPGSIRADINETTKRKKAGYGSAGSLPQKHFAGTACFLSQGLLPSLTL